MADLRALMRLRPEYGTFHNRHNLVRRGEVVVFRPNNHDHYFSTDEAGFRHSTLNGKPFTVADALNSPSYGIVLGSSHIFGLGLSGNENTLPSLLSSSLRMPFANVSLPEGNSRNLFALLHAYLARAPNRPSIVVHFSGGDFTSFCIGGSADSVFGSPNLVQVGNASKRAASYASPERFIPAVLGFSSLWTSSIVRLCRASRVPLVLGNDTTFFEKQSEATESERHCGLGVPFNPLQQHWFSTHRRFFGEFLRRRREIATKRSVPLAAPGERNHFTFIDEFHYDAAGTRDLASEVAKIVQPLL